MEVDATGDGAAAIFGTIAIVIMIFGGKPLLGAAFGQDFITAYPALMIMLGVPLLTIISFPLPSTFYALDRPDGPLKARIVATITYFAIIAPLTHAAGLRGTALAFLIANAVLVVTLAFMLSAEYRRVRVQ